MAIRLRNLVLLLAVIALALPAIVAAQRGHQATLLLRNGERLSGLLEGIEDGTVYVRASLNDQQKRNLNDVVLIDFVGNAENLPDAEVNLAKGADHVVAFRDGTTWTGRMVHIFGGERDTPLGTPYELHFRPSTGEQRVPLDKVARVYLGNFPVTTVAQGVAADPLPPGTLRVPANQRWVETPLTVRQGDRVVFNVSGQIQLSEDPEDVAISAGSLRQRRATGSPLPQHLAGALIGRVGNSPPFPIGNVTTPVTMPAGGRLFLGINDDEVGDNRGEFIVNFQYLGATRR